MATQMQLAREGKVTDVVDAGIHFKLPLGIQQAHKVSTNVYQKIELGYSSSGGNVFNESESTMITGDYNIVNVDFFVEYKISDPVQYLFSSDEPELILRNLIQSQVRNVVGSSSVDAVLTDGKENIQMQVKELVTRILQEYDIGLTLVDVKIQDAEPPTAEVIEAFKAVETAKQQAETVINDAKAYKNAQIPNAQAKADKLIQNAEYLKQKRINEAAEQVLGLGHPEDILIGISTSGNSANVIYAVQLAKTLGIKTIGLIGNRQCRMQNLCDIVIAAPELETNSKRLLLRGEG